MSYTLNITTSTPETFIADAVWTFSTTITVGAEDLVTLRGDTELWNTIGTDIQLTVTNMSNSYLTDLFNIIKNRSTKNFSLTFGSGSSNIAIPDNYLGYRANLKSVDLRGVTSIGHDAFTYCTNLSSVTLYNGLTKIDYAAFEGCDGLEGKTIRIPSSVNYLGAFIFGTPSTAVDVNLTYEDTNSQWARYDYDDSFVATLSPKQPTTAQLKQTYETQMHYKIKP